MCDTVEKNINIILPKYFARKKENEVAAEYEYKGKQMLIKGEVVSVKKREHDFDNYTYAAIAKMDISGDPDYDSEKMEGRHLVYCLFDEEHLPSAAKLRSGTKAAIYSTFVSDYRIVKHSLLGTTTEDDVIVDNCVVVQSDASDEFTRSVGLGIGVTFDRDNAVEAYQKIRKLCKSNEIAGEFASGYRVRVTGTVSKIYKNLPKYSEKETLVIFIDMSENPDPNNHIIGDFGRAVCYFDMEDLKDVIKVVCGDKVTIAGYVNTEKVLENDVSIMYFKGCRLTSLQRMCEVL